MKKTLSVSTFLISSLLSLSVLAADSGIKKFSGRLPSGTVCQVMYTSAVQDGVQKLTAVQFDLNNKKMDLRGPSLMGSEFNSANNLFQGAGVLDRKIIITSEVLGVGYETGINVEFQIKLNPQSHPSEYQLSLQNYRNDYVFGSWVQGERSEAQTFNCR